MIIKEEFENKFKHLESAVNSLKQAIIFAQKHKDFEDLTIIRDSNIQRFEYTLEMSWKFMKYLPEKYDREIETRKPKAKNFFTNKTKYPRRFGKNPSTYRFHGFFPSRGKF